MGKWGYDKRNNTQKRKEKTAISLSQCHLAYSIGMRDGLRKGLRCNKNKNKEHTRAEENDEKPKMVKQLRV